MIRVNLIGRRTRAKARAPKGQLYVFLAILIVEVVFMFVWYQSASSTTDMIRAQANQEREKVRKLKEVKKEWDKWQKEKQVLQNQMKVLDNLRYGQLGPARLLRFFSYALTKVSEDPQHLDEIKAQELAGWDSRWNPKRVWLKSMSNREGKVRVVGVAVDHGDVAEFYKRLESCAYIVDLQPGLQRKEKSKAEGKLKLGFEPVEFQTTFKVRYDVPLGLENGLALGVK